MASLANAHSGEVIATLVLHTEEAVLVATADGSVTHYSRAAGVLLGWTGNDDTSHIASILMAEGNTWQGRLLANGEDGPTVVLHKTWVAPDQSDSAIVAWMETNAAKGNESSNIDPLTLLPTRAIFFDRLQQGIISADRMHKSLAMLLVGVDRLTIVNDAMGYAAGDRLLVELGMRLSQCVRASDAVTRLDGDTFGLAMAITSVDDSILVAEKVFQAIHDPFVLDGRELFITVSIGIGLYPTDASSQSDLIKKSESALRHAKTNGGNMYKFASSNMNSRALQRLELEARLRRALKQGEFVVYYQPKVSSDTGIIVGVEALVRWQDPDLGMIMPNDFISIAEETGMIIGIGGFVLAEACRQNVRWLADGLPPLRLSVNVSARQFHTTTFVDEVAAVLSETGLPPAMLELEITESMLMDNVDQVIIKFQALRSLGVGLSIDDFGTGYSSLSYLGKFPITTLKIDRAFVQGVESNSKTAEIARAIIGLSKGLELEVIAEGAETIGHVQFLKDHGCLLVQGYFYSRPLPAAEFTALIRQGPIPIHATLS